MKRLMVFVLTMVLVFSSLSAIAAVPSKTTTDLVHAVTAVTLNGVAVDPGFVIEVTVDKEQVVAELAKIYEHVVNEGGSAIEYFDEDVNMAVAAMLPETVDSSTLELNEFVTLQAINYDEAYGDMDVTFQFVTEYAEDQILVALVGLYTGEVDASGNNVVEWVALNAVAQADGSVVVTFTADVLARLHDAPAAAMAILSTPVN